VSTASWSLPAERTREGWTFALLAGGLVVATIVAVVLTDGHPLLSLAPALAAIVFFVVARLPLRVSVLVLTFLVLAVDFIPERPQSGLWQSPLFPLGRLLFENLNSLSGVSAFHFPSLDPIVLALLGLAALRSRRADASAAAPVARCVVPYVFVCLLGLVWLEAYGIARGGNFKESLWQFHQIGFAPLIALLYAAVLRGRRDRVVLARIIIVAAMLKAAVAMYFIEAIVRPRGIFVEFATSHSDTFTFVTALVILFVWWFEHPTTARLLRALGPALFIGTGFVLNDRRMAYVSLGAGVVTAFLMSGWTPLKRRLARGLILGSPLILVYVVLGLQLHSRVFLPVKVVQSVLIGRANARTMTDYRDTENFDLMMTWNKNPVLGSGWGHTFDTPQALPSISKAMPQWQYQPHNQVLFLWATAGLFGWAALWAYIVVTIYLAARAYGHAREAEQRASALIALSIVITYANQCFGDMGTLSWIGAFYLAGAVAVAGQLSLEVGAWPAARAGRWA
jgi:hypothetical protein